MATYAPNGIDANDDTTYTFVSGKSPNRYHLMRLMRKKGMRELGEFIEEALAENTPSDTMSVTISQVTAATGQQGGVRTVAAQEIVGGVLDSTISDTAETARAATDADSTLIEAEIIPTGNTALRAPSASGTITYPTDASGNGGGGKFE
jgi:hypothetical protein